MSWVAAAGLGVSVLGGLFGASKQKKQAKQQARIAEQQAQHAREVAQYNAQVLRDQAIRLRQEGVKRITEVSGINLDRLGLGLRSEVGRVETIANLNADRVLEDSAIQLGRIESLAELNIGQINEVAATNIGRLETAAKRTVQAGFEAEDDIRTNTAEVISTQRATYAARGVLIDTGTPAAMQIGTAQRGEIDALRVRRNYRVAAEDMLEQAGDIKSQAAFQVGNILRESALQSSDIARNRDQTLGDIRRQTEWYTSDLVRDYEYQWHDINRGIGYDLADLEYEASKLDQEAVLTMLQGDAALLAGQNLSDAYKQGGQDAFIGGILGSIGTGLSGFNPSWFSKSSAAVTGGTINLGSLG